MDKGSDPTSHTWEISPETNSLNFPRESRFYKSEGVFIHYIIFVHHCVPHSSPTAITPMNHYHNALWRAKILFLLLHCESPALKIMTGIIRYETNPLLKGLWFRRISHLPHSSPENSPPVVPGDLEVGENIFKPVNVLPPFPFLSFLKFLPMLIDFFWF